MIPGAVGRTIERWLRTQRCDAQAMVLVVSESREVADAVGNAFGDRAVRVDWCDGDLGPILEELGDEGVDYAIAIGVLESMPQVLRLTQLRRLERISRRGLLWAPTAGYPRRALVDDAKRVGLLGWAKVRGGRFGVGTGYLEGLQSGAWHPVMDGWEASDFDGGRADLDQR